MSDHIKLAHGGGGSMMHDLIQREIVAVLGNTRLNELADSARIDLNNNYPLAFTTDGFVIQPLIFPGGDIGKLAVCGTVNDLAARGAKPMALSLAIIAEEGLPISTFRRVLTSIAAATRQARIDIVTGDTKVVERGGVNGLFLTTAGLGQMQPNLDFGPKRIEPGDAVIVNGPIGDHGIAVMSVRQGVSFVSAVESDVAPLADMVAAVLDAVGNAVRCMKDPTRGGLAASLNEMAVNTGFTLNEQAIPVRPEVSGACELLGFDPLTVANEGKMLFVAAPHAAEMILDVLHRHPLGRQAAVIGHADKWSGAVRLKTAIGGERIIDMPYGEELPRIC